MRDRNPASRSRSPSPARPDQERTRDAALEQSDAAQDQRAHDALAELGFRDEDVAQSRRWHDQRLDRLRRARVYERRPTGELVQLGDEPAGAMGDDGLLVPERVVLCDRDLAGENDEHAGAHVAGGDQPLARCKAARLGEAPQPFDLGRIELRKHLIEAGLDDRPGSLTHRRLDSRYPARIASTTRKRALPLIMRS